MPPSSPSESSPKSVLDLKLPAPENEPAVPPRRSPKTYVRRLIKEERSFVVRESLAPASFSRKRRAADDCPGFLPKRPSLTSLAARA